MFCRHAVGAVTLLAFAGLKEGMTKATPLRSGGAHVLGRAAAEAFLGLRAGRSRGTGRLMAQRRFVTGPAPSRAIRRSAPAQI